MVGRAASRRSMLRLMALSGVALIGGCSDDDGPPAPGTPTGSADATASPYADELLLEQVRDLLTTLLTQSRAAAGGGPDRRSTLTFRAVSSNLSERLVALGADGAPADPGRASSAGRAQRRLASAVVAAQRDTVRLAGKAVSGDLARLVASVSAGLLQDAAALTTGDAVRSLNSAKAGLTTSAGRDFDDEAVLEAAQLVLAGEHAAVYAYGVIGGRSPSREAGLATRNFIVHRARRDALTTSLRESGAEPVVAEPGYALPVDVAAATPAQRVGQQIEDRCSVLYATLVAAAPASTRTRQEAVTALTDAGLRLVDWGGEAAALPGVQLP